MYNCDSINPFENDFNLFFATEKKEGYVNIYENNWTDAHIYPSKIDALAGIDGDMIYVNTIKIDWEV